MRPIAALLALCATTCVPAAGEIAGNDADGLLLVSDSNILMGRCARTSWVSGPIALGARHRLKCGMIALSYAARRAGYTDTMVQVLQKDEHARFELGGIWEAQDRLTILTAKLGDGAPVRVHGLCTGRFERPPDRYFESGGVTDGMDNASDGGDAPEPVETLDCTVSDLQGNAIGAISFSTR